MVEKACRDTDDGNSRQQPAEYGRRPIQPEMFLSLRPIARAFPQCEKQIVHVNLHPAKIPWPPAGRSGRMEVDIFAQLFFLKSTNIFPEVPEAMSRHHAVV
jgi:hypothetical protein